MVCRNPKHNKSILHIIPPHISHENYCALCGTVHWPLSLHRWEAELGITGSETRWEKFNTSHVRGNPHSHCLRCMPTEIPALNRTCTIVNNNDPIATSDGERGLPRVSSVTIFRSFTLLIVTSVRPLARRKFATAVHVT